MTNSQDCKKRNCVYETECLTCRDRGFKILEEKYADEGKEKIEERKKKASKEEEFFKCLTDSGRERDLFSFFKLP